MKSIAVYCGAATGNSEIYQQAAENLGGWLAQHKIDLIYGGGRFGLMGIVAKAALTKGGRVHGIITQELAERGAAYKDITQLDIVPNMSIRKTKMLTLSDGCIALPGGPGTLEEIAEAFSWARLGDNSNPCVFYNVDGYYEPLKAMFDQMTEKEFLTKVDREKLLFSDDLAEIFDFMAHYLPPEIRRYNQNVG
ncbi:TIGR00730 family Rossman fold protein [Agrilactobacillus yilanensis]|uniref:Cytokinin riboside 5'-monophosphate phosphoribohydrolase n=1 Tax=Agrilactobacillus yilanensis TaxID=2485997 RepID=A0ABW4J5N0_9LACO|nr:TIGR00730 family Rossman fold protein [Agrilactobacillus yilanensis]